MSQQQNQARHFTDVTGAARIKQPAGLRFDTAGGRLVSLDGREKPLATPPPPAGTKQPSAINPVSRPSRGGDGGAGRGSACPPEAPPRRENKGGCVPPLPPSHPSRPVSEEKARRSPPWCCDSVTVVSLKLLDASHPEVTPRRPLASLNLPMCDCSRRCRFKVSTQFKGEPQRIAH